MERVEEFGALRWLARRNAVNQLKWSAKQPFFWASVGVLAVLTVVLPIGAFSSPWPAPVPPATVPFGPVLTLTSVTILVAGFFGITAGGALLVVQRPVVDIVYPSPVRRSSYMVFRVRGALLQAIALGALFSLALGALFSSLVALPVEQVAVAVFVGQIPAALVWMLLTFLAGYGGSRLGERGQGWAALVFLASVPVAMFVGLPGIFLLDGNVWDDPLVLLFAALALGPAKLLIGIPLAPAEYLPLALSWLLIAVLSAVAIRTEYVVYEDKGTGTMATGESYALSQEHAPSSAWMERISRRLRSGYRDYGVGWRALLGKNTTGVLRGAGIWINVLWFAMLPVMLIVFGGRYAVGFVVMFAMMFGLALPMATFPSGMDHGAAANLRLLPLRPQEIWKASMIPGLVQALAWVGIVVSLVLLLGGGIMLAGAGALMLACLAFLGSSLAFFSSSLSPSVPSLPQQVQGSEPGWATAVIMLPMLFIFPAMFTSFSLAAGSPTAGLEAAAFCLVSVSAGAGWSLVGMLRFRHPPRR